MASWRREPSRRSGPWVAYRQCDPAYPPLWYSAGGASLRQESARWHRIGEGVAQYCSLSAHGAWAELARFEDLGGDGGDRRLEYRRALWALHVAEGDIADLSAPAAWERCGLDPGDATGAHAATQALGDELRSAGYRGVLSPSAALPGALNLTLFGERIEIDLGAAPLGAVPEAPDLFVPVIQLADAAAPTARALRDHARS